MLPSTGTPRPPHGKSISAPRPAGQSRLAGVRRAVRPGLPRCGQRPGVRDEFQRRSPATRQPAGDEGPPVASRIQDGGEHRGVVAVCRAAEAASADGLDPVPEPGCAAANARTRSHAACLPGRARLCYLIGPNCNALEKNQAPTNQRCPAHRSRCRRRPRRCRPGRCLCAPGRYGEVRCPGGRDTVPARGRLRAATGPGTR